MASVRFYHTQRVRKNKEIQILGRFTIDRANRFSFATGEKLPADCWDAVRQQAKGKYPHAMEFNQSLSKIKDDVIHYSIRIYKTIGLCHYLMQI